MKNVAFTAIIAILVGVLCACGAKKQEVRWVEGPMPANGNFDGVYQSDFGRLELTASGNKVVGLYEGDNFSGRIEGEIDNNLLYFKWTQWNQEMRGKVRETTGEGVFQYVVDQVPTGNKTKEYHRLEGWWGYSDSDMSNKWDGSKLSNKAKKKLEPYRPEKSEMDQEEESYESGGFEDSSGGNSQPAEPESEGSVDDIF